MQVNADYPGGNVVVERIEGDTLYVRQDLANTEGWWFYFNFKVTGAQGRKLTVVFTEKTNGGPLSVMGPCIRIDSQPWAYLGNQGSYDTFTLDVPADATTVQIAFTVPYTQQNLDAYLASRKGIDVSVLGQSKQGRDLLNLSVPSAKKKYKLLMKGRAHACESMASYLLEGVIDAFLSHEGNLAAYRNENISLSVLPIYDLDGVENGDQGKNRIPHDHNRDWIDSPVHPETVIAMNWINERADSNTWVIDAHCPWVRGGGNDTVYFVGQPAASQVGVDELCREIKPTPPESLPYDISNNLAFGDGWNVGSKGGSSAWIRAHHNVRAACTIEVPYAQANGVTVTEDRCRALGRELANALSRVCMKLDSKE